MSRKYNPKAFVTLSRVFLVLGEVAQNNNPIIVQKVLHVLATYWGKGVSPSFQMPYIHRPIAYGLPHNNSQ